MVAADKIHPYALRGQGFHQAQGIRFITTAGQ